MRAFLITLLTIFICIGCANSNVYSRGEIPPWYENTISTCEQKTEECLV